MLKTTSIALGLALLASTALAGGTVASTNTKTRHTRGAPATEFQVTNLVSDQDGTATTTDPDLINAW
ncbi:MAG TPA: hypothetical protein VMF58_17455, partial [Rhizomicrobium sp.]|nr:hypothetical protein [Rhizomicrobium sp.]